jgi:potassium-transporting ATPase KdpC subunit
MLSEMKPAILITIVFTVITGIIYPLGMTGIAQALFPHQANGSLVDRNGQTVGSELIGQNFTKPEYFHPRPSAAGNGYDAANSGGSNLGPTNPALGDRLEKAAAQFRTENPDFTGAIPSDATTASGSGLDPDITPANAAAQAPRVAKARGMTLEAVQSLIASETQQRDLGVLGEPRVNVLRLNMALEAGSGAQK